jgi:CheY-like chemotaxis protein
MNNLKDFRRGLRSQNLRFRLGNGGASCDYVAGPFWLRGNKAEKPDEQASESWARHRVLIVGDGADIAEMFIMMIGLNVDVRVAYDGKAALEIFATFKPELVFMDFGIRVTKGCETARHIRQLSEDRNILLVALARWAQYQDCRRNNGADFDEYLVKPINAEQAQKLLARQRA